MASSDASELADVPETRLGYDGRRYTKKEFLEWYGDAGERLWPDAGGSDAMVSSDASQLADGRTDEDCVELKCEILTDCVHIPKCDDRYPSKCVSLLFRKQSVLEAKAEGRICRIRTPSPEAQSTIPLHPPGLFLTVDSMLTNLRKRWNPETHTLTGWKTHIFQNDGYHAAFEKYMRIERMMENLKRMGFQSIQDQDEPFQKKKPFKLCNCSLALTQNRMSSIHFD